MFNFSACRSRALLVSQESLHLAKILESELPGLGEMSHKRPRGTAEQLEKFRYQPVVRCIARDDRLEDKGIADLLDPSNGGLLFEAADNCLDGRVGGTFFLREDRKSTRLNSSH